MAIVVDEFNPSVTILGTDYISQTDDKIRTIMDESKTYLEQQTQSAVTQMEANVDAITEDAAASKDSAQLLQLAAQAEQMTADSYANEPEDVFVKKYTSNGDGTFTSVDTSEYSAFHYSIKAYKSAATVDVNFFGNINSMEAIIVQENTNRIIANPIKFSSLTINNNGTIKFI